MVLCAVSGACPAPGSLNDWFCWGLRGVSCTEFSNDWFCWGLRGVSSTEFGALESLCKAVVKDKQPFERLEVSKETLLEMFKVRTPPRSGCMAGQRHAQPLM